MSENKKTISIDQELFKINPKKNKKNKTEKKEKKKNIMKPNRLRKDLLSKIKKHQQMEQLKTKNENQELETKNTFNESLEYLHELSKRKREKNKTQKNPQIKTNHNIEIDLPSVFIDTETAEIKHTINNNESHPTVSNQNAGKNPELSISNVLPSSLSPVVTPPLSPAVTPPLSPVVTPQPTVTENIKTTSESENIDNQHNVDSKISLSDINLSKDIPYGCLKGGKKPTYRIWSSKTLKNNVDFGNDEIPKKYKQKKKKTKKTTYTLGKTQKKISVLIKNSKTRRNVQTEIGKLKQKSISEIKKYLYDKNLLKIGSSAPNDVLRTMYEQAILTGDVTNNTAGVLLHNYLSEQQ